MRPGNTPPVEILTPLPVATMSGACFASDIRGTDRYIYYLAPTSTTTAQFWRYDTYANSWQQLASPLTLAGGNARFGTGCALVVDPSSFMTRFVVMPPVTTAPDVWLFHPHAIAPWAQFQAYSATTNTWYQASQAGGAFNAGGLGNAALNGQWAGDAAMTHTDVTVSSVSNDLHFYVTGSNIANIGGNATYFYRYECSSGTVAAMTAHGAATGVGCSLAWISQVPDRLYYQRGGATATWEYYDIANNAWVAVAPIPNTETYTTGTSLIGDVSRAKFVTRPSTITGGQIKMYDFDPISLALSPVGNGYLGDGTPHSGALMAMASTGTQKYLYLGKFTSTNFQRVWIVE